MLLVLYLPTAVLLSLLRFFDGLKMLVHDFSSALWSAVSFGGMFLALTFLTKQNMGSITPQLLVVLQLPSAAFALLVVTCLGFTKDITWGNVPRFWLHRFVNYGRFGMGTNICSMIFQRADTLLLGAFVPPAALGAYNIATRIIGYLDFPLNNLGLALFPRLAAESKASGTEGVILLYEKFVGWLLALTLPLTAVIVIGAPWIVWLIAGDRFPDAVLLVQILAAAGIVKPWGRLFGMTLDAIGKPQWNFRILLMSMSINILLNVCLIPFFGILGAAVATALAIILTIGIGQILLRRTLPIRAARAWLYILPTYRQALKLLH
jgi:lipopolysaccharide exporter